MATKKSGIKRIQILTAVLATIFCSFCWAMGILQEDISHFTFETWLILGAGIFTLGAVWFIVIITPNA